MKTLFAKEYSLVQVLTPFALVTFFPNLGFVWFILSVALVDIACLIIQRNISE